MDDQKPHIIVPRLIKQPTWGGGYIAKTKNIKEKTIASTPIGQSYELVSDILLSTKNSTQHNPSYQLSDSANQKTKNFFSNDKPFPLSKFQKTDLLIKFTQAQGNSFQLHVPPSTKSKSWQPKPESWYFLKPGLATIGIKTSTDLNEYRVALENIDQKAKKISKDLNRQKINYQDAIKLLKDFIHRQNPYRFVNLVQLGKNDIVDLSSGGIHHSWEESTRQNSQGNIVYELQKDVLDEISTIRAFDKGKIKKDNSIRPLHINDYFQFINTNPSYNQPPTLISKPKILKRSSTYTVRRIFDNPHYQLREIVFVKTISNKFTLTQGSFHHLFVREGSVVISTQNSKLHLTAGFSAFIPQTIGQYQITPKKCYKASVLQSFVIQKNKK